MIRGRRKAWGLAAGLVRRRSRGRREKMARAAVVASTPSGWDSRAGGCGEPSTTMEAVGGGGRARQLGRFGDSRGRYGNRRRRGASRSTRELIAPERGARRGYPRRVFRTTVASCRVCARTAVPSTMRRTQGRVGGPVRWYHGAPHCKSAPVNWECVPCLD